MQINAPIDLTTPLSCSPLTTLPTGTPPGIQQPPMPSNPTSARGPAQLRGVVPKADTGLDPNSNQKDKNSQSRFTGVRVGADSIYTSKCKGVDAKFLLPVAMVTKTQTVSRLITTIADQAAAAVKRGGKAAAAGKKAATMASCASLHNTRTTSHTPKSSIYSTTFPTFSFATKTYTL